MPVPLHNVSINTATLGYKASIRETVDAIAHAGFGGIAPWRREIESGAARTIGRYIRDAGLRVSGYCRSTYFPASSPEAWSASIEDNRQALRDAAELGAECFVLVAGGLPNGSRDLAGARQQIADGIAALMRDAAALGVPLAIEPLHPMYAADRSCINTIEQALDLCTLLDPSGIGPLGVAIDVYHTWWDPKLEAMIGRAGRENRILAYHVNDWLDPTSDLLMDRGLPGEGVIDLSWFGNCIRDTGYNGLSELEVFSKLLQNTPNDQLLKKCAASLTAL
ncbi:sugar phosphate isomerase/epimerase family protein [Aureimonas sp. Leaf454]|uniref:sugar phosphate isomerase/epimerase family protein n=1 Tax=Aureimonas sp. Leaf454 TaxID=1736381 RepID=UPI0019103C0E|nr:sugar phosphate isomerase/epimerase family protein [Aureimonas sp. Leaf454]